MRYFIRNNKIQLVFTLMGAAAGFLYWNFVGCSTGTCVIKSVWYWSTLWAAAVGYLIGDLLNDFLIKRKNKEEEQ